MIQIQIRYWGIKLNEKERSGKKVCDAALFLLKIMQPYPKFKELTNDEMIRLFTTCQILYCEVNLKLEKSSIDIIAEDESEVFKKTLYLMMEIQNGKNV